MTYDPAQGLSPRAGLHDQAIVRGDATRRSTKANNRGPLGWMRSKARPGPPGGKPRRSGSAKNSPTSPGDDPRRYRSGDNSAQRSGGDQPLPVHPHGEGGQSVKHTFIITEIIQICQLISTCFKTYTRMRQHKRDVRSQCRICRTY